MLVKLVRALTALQSILMREWPGTGRVSATLYSPACNWMNTVPFRLVSSPPTTPSSSSKVKLASYGGFGKPVVVKLKSCILFGIVSLKIAMLANPVVSTVGIGSVIAP